jgi:hypothetical protein
LILCYNTVVIENKPKFVLPERNPVTHAAHRREVFWQITFPLILTLLILLGLAAFVIYTGFQGAGSVSRWADISLIWLLLPAVVVTLVVLLILIGLVYLISKLLGVFPGYARLVQNYFHLAQVRTRSIADKVVEPVLKLRSLKAGADVLRKK